MSAVYLVGYYGHGNFGDELMRQIVITELRSIINQACFVVHNDDALGDQSLPKWRRLTRYIAQARRELKGFSWMIFGGGTTFHTRANLVLRYLLCLAARSRGVRIAALGVGVETDMSPLSLWIIRRIVTMSECFLVRDEHSLAQCPGAVLTADLVFAWADKFPKPNKGDRLLSVVEKGPIPMPDYNGVGRVASNRYHPLVMAEIFGVPWQTAGTSRKVIELQKYFKDHTLEDAIVASKRNFSILESALPMINRIG